MSRNKKLFYQFMIAVNKCFKPGVDKHSYKKSNCSKEIIFSYAYMRKIIEVIDQLCKYISKEYPQIKLIKEINSTHIQNFINFKKNTCTIESLKSYLYTIGKVERMVRQEMNLKINYIGGIVIDNENVKRRDVAMDKNDLKVIENDISRSNSKAKLAIKLAEVFGLRVSEICKLQGRDIDIVNKKIHIHEGKGKRSRDLKIDTNKKMELCEYIKSYVGEMDRVVAIREDSVNTFLRRALLKKNITRYKNSKTGIHSIRKLYAKDEYKKEIVTGVTDKEAIGKVSKDLGHGKNRKITYTAYINSK